MSAQLEALGRLWGCPPTMAINVNSRYNVAICESTQTGTFSNCVFSSFNPSVHPWWRQLMDRGKLWCLIPEEPVIRYLHGIYCPPPTDAANTTNTTAATRPPDLYSVRQNIRLVVDCAHLTCKFSSFSRTKMRFVMQYPPYNLWSTALRLQRRANPAALPVWQIRRPFSHTASSLCPARNTPVSLGGKGRLARLITQGHDMWAFPQLSRTYIHVRLVVWKAGHVLRHNTPIGQYRLEQLLEFRGIPVSEINMIKDTYGQWTRAVAEQSGTSPAPTTTTSTTTATTTFPSTSTSQATHDAGGGSNTQGNQPSSPSAPPSSRENPDPPRKRQRQSSPPPSGMQTTQETGQTWVYSLARRVNMVTRGIQKRLEQSEPCLRSENGVTKSWDRSKHENQLCSENLEKLGPETTQGLLIHDYTCRS